MPLIPLFSALFGFLGASAKGFFGFKQEQAQVVSSAISTISNVASTDGEVANASASVLSSIMNNGSILERNWRPILMCLIIYIIGSFWFGYTPPHFNDPMSPMMERIFTMLEIGLGGYLPLRSIDKWVKMFQVSKILQMLIEKRFS